MRKIGEAICGCAFLGFLFLLFVPQAGAQLHTVKVAIPQKGLFDTTMPFVIGDKAGLYKAEGIQVEIVWTRGGGETNRAAATGSTDIAHDTGLLGILAGYVEKAPLKIVMVAATGNELFWYVKADSPYRSIQDMSGRTLGYSQAGSSTHMSVLDIIAATKVNAKPASVGSPPDSFTAVMTGQVDAGWSSPPFFLKEIQEGKTRVLFKGADFPELREITTRVTVANSDFLKKNPAAARGLLKAYLKTIDYMYANPKVTIDTLAEFNTLAPAVAGEAFKFFPKEFFNSKPIKGLEYSMEKAVEFKFIKKPLSKEDLNQLIDFSYLPQ